MHISSLFDLNLIGLFSTERGKRDLEDLIDDWDLRMKKGHSKCNNMRISSLFDLNLIGLFSTERGKRDLENSIIDWDLRLKQ